MSTTEIFIEQERDGLLHDMVMVMVSTVFLYGTVKVTEDPDDADKVPPVVVHEGVAE